MTRESLEELRKRLLGQQSVQQMIQIRAYEIYRMRGGHPGEEAQDWFHAEGEVLAFLIAHESAREDDIQDAESADVASATATQPAAAATRKSGVDPARAKQAAPKKTAPKRATPGKSAESRSKSKRTNKQSKKKESAE